MALALNPSFVRTRLSRSALILALTSLMVLPACDRQSSGTEQANQAEAEADSPALPANLSGQLDISNRGKPAPDASFVAPDGKTVTLADFKGKPVLVNLWATWCAPCVVEMPTLDALAGREEARLTVLTVSQDRQSIDQVKPFFEEKQFAKLQPYLDQENNLGVAYEAGVMPTTILYDAEGREVWRMLGGMDWNGSRAAALMEETLAKAPAAD